MLVGFEGEDKGFLDTDAIVVTLAGQQCKALDYWIKANDNSKLDPMLGGENDVTLE